MGWDLLLEIVVAFGPDVIDGAEEPPEYIVDDENGTTFLDPDTLEPLVTITEDDWMAAYNKDFVEPELFVGWSADGELWSWQTTTDAFGADGGAQLAVGDGVVVAIHQALDAADPNAVRVFTARID